MSRAGNSLAGRRFRNPEKQTYTHAGIAVKYPSGGWKFIHLLNTCGGPSSDIYEQGLATFLNNMYAYDYAIGVPSEGLQEMMAKVFLEGDQPSELSTKILHNPRYSSISNPFHQSDRFQNSNQWLLSVVASAQSGCRTIPDCRHVYTEKDFTPSEVKVKRKQRLMKAVDDGLGIGAQPNVHLGDHTLGERARTWYRFVSAASIYDYIRRSDDLIYYEDFCHQAGCGVPRVQIEAVD